MISRALLLGLTSCALPWLAGCRDLDRFDTDQDSAYCGSLVSAPFAHTGFVAEDEPPLLRMRLRLDVDELTTVPAIVATDDAERGLCAPEPMFDDARMRAMKEAFHDPLSTLEFGQGREYNILAWVDSSCQGTMVAVISLMKNDDVEVRLLKPAPSPPRDAPPEELPGFAQFRLSRRQGDCGF